MRRAGGLWEALSSFENLHCAAGQALRGKRERGDAARFHNHLEDELLRLRAELVEGRYAPGGYRTFWIQDPKARLISAAPFRDRVVHHALVNVVEPVFERRFIHHSYACRTGRGNHRALRQLVGWLRGHRYVLKLDVRKFFPSIDHEILIGLLSRAIKDERTLELCSTLIAASNPQEPVSIWLPGDDLFTPFERRRGIPIGNLTSQFFANVYLDALDHFVKQKLGVRCYLRYVDDFCFFADDKRILREWRREIVSELARLRLVLNEGKSRIRQCKEGVEFLGFVAFPSRLRLSQTAVRRQRRRLREQEKAYAAGDLSLPALAQSVGAWLAHAAHGSTRRLAADALGSKRFVRSSPSAQRQPSHPPTTIIPKLNDTPVPAHDRALTAATAPWT